MFPDLLTYAPRVQAEFHFSLPQDVITSLRLLQAVDSFEGLSEWVYQTAAILTPDFLAELDLLSYPIKWCFKREDSLLWRLPLDDPAHSDMDAFCAHLETTPATEFQAALLLNLAREVAHLPSSTERQPVDPGRIGELTNTHPRQTLLPRSHPDSELQPTTPPDDTTLHQMLRIVRKSELRRWGHPLVELENDHSLVQLIQDPKALKKRLITLLARFWNEYYQKDFENHRQAIRHSVTYHRRQPYRQNFVDLFRQVTGRSLSPAIQDLVHTHLGTVERVIFVPCAHLGLYFQITLCYSTLIVAFNYRTTPARQRKDTTAASLFPPLKALADETRLHILSLLQEREMYAQQIVRAVGLSQSTVSRHLQLLERTELVTIRQVRGMKFYSINKAKGHEIVHILQHLIG